MEFLCIEWSGCDGLNGVYVALKTGSIFEEINDLVIFCDCEEEDVRWRFLNTFLSCLASHQFFDLDQTFANILGYSTNDDGVQYIVLSNHNFVLFKNFSPNKNARKCARKCKKCKKVNARKCA